MTDRHDARDQRFVCCKACQILQSRLPGNSASISARLERAPGQKNFVRQPLAFALASGMECDAIQTLIAKPLAIEQLYLVGSPTLSIRLGDPVRFSHLASLKLIRLGIGDQHRSSGLRRELEVEAKRQGIR